MSRDSRAKRSGWVPLSPGDVLGVLLALAAVVLGAFSQWTRSGVAGVYLWGFLMGCGLTSSISLFLAFDAQVMGWSVEAGRRQPGGDGIRSGVFGLPCWYVLATSFAALPAGFMAGERFTEGMLLNLAVGLAAGVAALLWRTGYLRYRRPGLVGLMSFIPVLSGLLLSVFGGLETDPRLMISALGPLCLSGLLACRGRDLPAPAAPLPQLHALEQDRVSLAGQFQPYCIVRRRSGWAWGAVRSLKMCHSSRRFAVTRVRCIWPLGDGVGRGVGRWPGIVSPLVRRPGRRVRTARLRPAALACSARCWRSAVAGCGLASGAGGIRGGRRSPAPARTAIGWFRTSGAAGRARPLPLGAGR